MTDIRDFNQCGKASVVFGGQYGSEGKGLAAGFLAEQSAPDVSVTNAAPNAGHTTITSNGKKFVTFHLPTAGVINEDSVIYLDAGAVVNLPMLLEEVETIGVKASRIVIHPRVALIEQQDIDYETRPDSATTKLASTRKGIGRAIARKVMREATLACQSEELQRYFHVENLDLNHMLKRGRSIMIEMPQGYGLGINSGFQYPNCTSRNISVAQALSDAEIHPSFLGNVMAVLRTFPIRVGNIVEDGQQIGYSGDVYEDQKEITFEDIGQQPEFTTVTKRQRRIFTFSQAQYADMVTQCRPTHVFLNFVNYLRKQSHLDYILNQINYVNDDILRYSRPKMLYGYGPTNRDVCYSRYEVVRYLADKIEA